MIGVFSRFTSTLDLGAAIYARSAPGAIEVLQDRLQPMARTTGYRCLCVPSRLSQPSHDPQLPRFDRTAAALSRRTKPMAALAFENLVPEHLLVFLSHLEPERGNSIGTRDPPLVAVHAIATGIHPKTLRTVPADTRRNVQAHSSVPSACVSGDKSHLRQYVIEDDLAFPRPDRIQPGIVLSCRY